MPGISFLASLATFCALIPATLGITYLFEGEACKLRHGGDGICGKLSVCRSAFSIPRNPPILCSPHGSDDIVCCPPEYINKTTQRKVFEDTETCSLLVDRDPQKTKESLSEKACQMYRRTFNENSESQHIVGGNKVEDIGNYPFMAALGYETSVLRNGTNETNLVYSCGGVLISDRFVLTAAHCEEGASHVKMGAVNLIEYNPDSKVFEVEKFIAHPCYIMNLSYYDIALVKLTEAIKVSNFIYPACISKDPEPDLNKAYSVSGWGATTKSGYRPSMTLLEASLTVQHPDNCSSKWQPNNQSSLPRGFAENTMLCATNPVKGATCKGDSGGPLSVNKPIDHFTVIGVISQGGTACGDKDKPGLVTKIYPFLLWIEDVIWPDGNILPLQWDEGAESDLYYDDVDDDDDDDDDDDCIEGEELSC